VPAAPIVPAFVEPEAKAPAVAPLKDPEHCVAKTLAVQDNCKYS